MNCRPLLSPASPPPASPPPASPPPVIMDCIKSSSGCSTQHYNFQWVGRTGKLRSGVSAWSASAAVPCSQRPSRHLHLGCHGWLYTVAMHLTAHQRPCSTASAQSSRLAAGNPWLLDFDNACRGPTCWEEHVKKKLVPFVKDKEVWVEHPEHVVDIDHFEATQIQ